MENDIEFIERIQYIFEKNAKVISLKSDKIYVGW